MSALKSFPFVELSEAGHVLLSLELIYREV